MNEPIDQLDAFYKLQSYPPYALPFGDTEIVVVSDGPLDLGSPEGSFRGASKDEIDERLSRNFLPTDRVVIEQNIPLLASGGKKILRNWNWFTQNVWPAFRGVFKPACKRQELIKGLLMPSYVRIPTPTTSAAFVPTTASTLSERADLSERE